MRTEKKLSSRELIVEENKLLQGVPCLFHQLMEELAAENIVCVNGRCMKISFKIK